MSVEKDLSRSFLASKYLSKTKSIFLASEPFECSLFSVSRTAHYLKRLMEKDGKSGKAVSSDDWSVFPTICHDDFIIILILRARVFET